MPSALENILTELDPRQIAEKARTRHTQALYQYPVKDNIPKTNEDFLNMIYAYYLWHLQTAVDPTTTRPIEMITEDAKRIVNQGFGSQGGLAGAYQVATIPIGEGMYAIYRLIAEFWAQKHEEDLINYVIDKYVSPMSLQEQVSVVRELQSRYQGFSTAYQSTPAEAMARDHRKLIAAHVETLKNFIPIYFRQG